MINPQRKISIVMPTYNGMGTIERAIKAIFEKTTYPNFELIVIDDGSTDGTGKWINDYRQDNKLNNLNYFRFDENHGVCTALNKGLELVSSNDIIRIDNDAIILTEDWIERFIKTAYSDEKIGIIHCCPLSDDGRIGSFEVKMITEGCISNPPQDLIKHRPNLHKKIIEIESAWLMCSYIKNSVISQTVIDENYNPCWVEDLDFCIQARRLGFKIICNQNIKINHTRILRNRESFKRDEQIERNLEYFQRKWWNFRDYRVIKKRYNSYPEIVKFLKFYWIKRPLSVTKMMLTKLEDFIIRYLKKQYPKMYYSLKKLKEICIKLTNKKCELIISLLVQDLPAVLLPGYSKMQTVRF